MLVVLWRIVLFSKISMFRARHSGVSNPSLGPSYRVIRNFKVTFVVYFSINGSFLQLNHTLTLVEEIFSFTRFTP